jgi:hypothetical protein
MIYNAQMLRYMQHVAEGQHARVHSGSGERVAAQASCWYRALVGRCSAVQ